MKKKYKKKTDNKYITEHMEEYLKSTPEERLNWLQNAKKFIKGIKHERIK